MSAHSGIRDVVDVDDLATVDDTTVLTYGDRVLVSLPPHQAAVLAHLIARGDTDTSRDVMPFAADVDHDWIPVIVQLLVAAAHLRGTAPAAVNAPILGAAS